MRFLQALVNTNNRADFLSRSSIPTNEELVSIFGRCSLNLSETTRDRQLLVFRPLSF